MKALLLIVTVGFLAAGCRTHHHHKDCHKDKHHAKCVTPLPAPECPTPTPPPPMPTPTEGETRLELKTEDMTVRKDTVSAGSLRVRKHVVSEQKMIPVTVCREDYVVERVPASGSPTTPWGGGEVVLDLPLTRETVVPVITPRVYETLRIRKTVDCETNTVTGTVRTEKYEIVR